jgi:hypothetical protein
MIGLEDADPRMMKAYAVVADILGGAIVDTNGSA